MALDFRFRWIKTKLFQMGNVRIDKISTDPTLAENSDTAVPTEKAVKAYVDNKAFTGNKLKDDPTPELAANLDVKGYAIEDSTSGVLNTPDIRIKGKLNIAVAESQAELDGSVGTLTFDEIPLGAWLIGYTLVNSVAVETDDDNTYSGSIAGTGSVIDINGGTDIAGTKNTKITQMTGIGITVAPVVVTLTPGGSGTAFSGGEVRIGIIYMAAEEYADVA